MDHTFAIPLVIHLKKCSHHFCPSRGALGAARSCHLLAAVPSNKSKVLLSLGLYLHFLPINQSFFCRGKSAFLRK